MCINNKVNTLPTAKPVFFFAGLVSSITKFVLRILALLCLSLPLLLPANANEIVLQEIKLQHQGDLVLVDIDFGVPLLYQKHFPQKFGEILQVQLNLSEDLDRPIHKEVRQANDIIAPPDLEGFLIYVTYEEGVPGGPYLTLRFARAVNFEVRAGSSLESLTIAVTDMGQAPVVTAGEGDAEPLGTSRKRRPLKRSTPDETKLDEMMAKARQTLTFGDTSGAIDLLRKLIRLPAHKHTQDARELLGLALERSNQIPRAKFEYKKYLQLYKKGEGPDRVRQRLTALQNLGIQRRKKLRRARRDELDSDFRWFGRWSQSYSSYFVQFQPDEGQPDPGRFVASRISSSNLNLRGRYRGSDSNIQTVLAASHLYDFEDRDETEGRISYANVEYDGFKSGVSGVIGRQRSRNSGVFERFDGIEAGYRIAESFRANFLAGQPVSFFDADLFDKKFWGIKADIGSNKAKLNGNAYYMHQTVDTQHDRQAVGGVVRYTGKSITGFALVDYDYGFKEFIAKNMRIGWQAMDKLKLNFSFNERYNLSLSKAVVSVSGITYRITDYVSEGLTLEEIRRIAVSRSYKNQNYTFGGTYQFDKDRQLNVDLNLFRAEGYGGVPSDIIGEGCDASNTGHPDPCKISFVPDPNSSNHILETVPIGDPTGNQYLLNMQWISTNTFVERDLHVVGIRVAKFSTYDQTGLYLNSRLPPYKNWNPRPRLNLYRRDLHPRSGDTESTQGYLTAIEPSIKVDYRWKRAWVFDLEFGLAIYRYGGGNNQQLDNTNQTVRMGYHYTF